MHVDDLISGCDTEAETLNFYRDTRDHLSSASFNLRKFQSNSMNLDATVRGHEHRGESRSKVLGLFWDRCSDEILFSFNHLNALAVEIPTKRELLTFMASVYDPLGLINPFIVKLKTLFQKVCLSKLAWDCKLNDVFITDWNAIREDFMSFSSISFKRWVYTLKDVEKVEIHGFSDASLKAYGGCIYLKVISRGELFVSLLAAKSRIAPSKSTTIPRLELMGALLLAKLVDRVRNEILCIVPLVNFFCWVDSMVALHWICGTDETYNMFVT